jgi:hypothetical protein
VHECEGVSARASMHSCGGVRVCDDVRVCLGVCALPGLTGFAMVINSVPHLAHPRASGVHYLDTSSLIKQKREETEDENEK